MANEELILKLTEFEQESQRFQHQIQAIDQQILELQVLQISLKELDKSKEKEMLANLGKGIFIRTEIKDKNLTVDVGNKTFVKKTIEEALKTVDYEFVKLDEGKNKILEQVQRMQEEATRIIAEAEQKK